MLTSYYLFTNELSIIDNRDSLEENDEQDYFSRCRWNISGLL